MKRKCYGWQGEILRIHLTKGKVVKQKLPKSLALNYIGGRGASVKTLFDELNPKIGALSPDNVLIFFTGPLNGTPLGFGRISVATKAITGCIAEGSFGGFFAPELKFSGYDGLIIYGKAEKPVYIFVDDEGVEIKNATDIWGRNTWETEKIIKEKEGDRNLRICCIGPAGENLVAGSVIISGLYNSGGRGCGQIMGAKNLKAIAVRGSKSVQIAYPKLFEQIYTRLRELAGIEGDDPLFAPFGIFGSASLVRIFNEAGMLQTFNNQTLRFRYADHFCGEALLEKYIKRSLSCFCCFCSCKRWYEIDCGLYADTKGGSIQVGGLISFNSNVGVKELEASLKAWTLCNQLGLDVFHTGYAISWAMECFEKGIITREDAGGVELHFGNYEATIELIKKIAYREGFGDILADTLDVASKKVGKGSDRYLMTVKGVALETMPLRALYLAALGVAVSETGPDHTKWYPPYFPHPKVLSEDAFKELGLAISQELLNPQSPVGKGYILKFLEDSRAVIESLPSCIFLLRGPLFSDLRPWSEIFYAVTGVNLSVEKLMKVGERIKNIERSFIVREGFRKKDDTLPRRVFEDSVPECGLPNLSKKVFNQMLKEYYKARKWDTNTSIPQKDKLLELGLTGVIKEFQKLKIEGY